MSVDTSRQDAWNAMQTEQQKRRSAIAGEPELPLFGGGGGGTLPPMDVVDAKIAASEARTDVKFAKMDGKLDLVLDRLEGIKADSTDAKSEARITRRTVVGTGISLAALLLAIFGLFNIGFNMGAKVSDVVHTEAQQAVENKITTAPSPSPAPVASQASVATQKP